ncbi:hypothetical protein GCM10010417_39700 [Streptomyces carpaticus]
MWSAAGTEGDPGWLLPPPGGFAAARRPSGANLVCAARLEGAFAARDCTRAAVSGVIRERPYLLHLRMEDHLHPTLHGPAAPLSADLMCQVVARVFRWIHEVPPSPRACREGG